MAESHQILYQTGRRRGSWCLCFHHWSVWNCKQKFERQQTDSATFKSLIPHHSNDPLPAHHAPPNLPRTHLTSAGFLTLSNNHGKDFHINKQLSPRCNLFFWSNLRCLCCVNSVHWGWLYLFTRIWSNWMYLTSINLIYYIYLTHLLGVDLTYINKACQTHFICKLS